MVAVDGGESGRDRRRPRDEPDGQLARPGRPPLPAPRREQPRPSVPTGSSPSTARRPTTLGRTLADLVDRARSIRDRAGARPPAPGRSELSRRPDVGRARRGRRHRRPRTPRPGGRAPGRPCPARGLAGGRALPRRRLLAARASRSASSRCVPCGAACRTTRSGAGSSSAAWPASASDWVSVDSLADVVARGMLLEPFRWAELEQLVYSPHRWERRLVGSTLAELPFRRSPAERADAPQPTGAVDHRDADRRCRPDVQKALSWALRSWREVDPDGVADLPASRGRRPPSRPTTAHRAWVIRDALTGRSADAGLAAELQAAPGGHPTTTGRARHEPRARHRSGVLRARHARPARRRRGAARRRRPAR